MSTSNQYYDMALLSELAYVRFLEIEGFDFSVKWGQTPNELQNPPVVKWGQTPNELLMRKVIPGHVIAASGGASHHKDWIQLFESVLYSTRSLIDWAQSLGLPHGP